MEYKTVSPAEIQNLARISVGFAKNDWISARVGAEIHYNPSQQMEIFISQLIYAMDLMQSLMHNTE